MAATTAKVTEILDYPRTRFTRSAARADNAPNKRERERAGGGGGGGLKLTKGLRVSFLELGVFAYSFSCFVFFVASDCVLSFSHASVVESPATRAGISLRCN